VAAGTNFQPTFETDRKFWKELFHLLSLYYLTVQYYLLYLNTLNYAPWFYGNTAYH
jgi:hypothetical protein